MDTDAEENPFSFVFPEELLSKLTDPNWCESYTPFPNTPFSPQKNNNYDPKVAAWCINTIIVAYRQYCDSGYTSYPPEVENGTHLYCHEALNIFEESYPIGFIGTIKPISKNDHTKQVIISFRGTETINEWLDNADFSQEEVTFINTTEYVKVLKGFWSALTKHRYHSLKEAIHNTKKGEGFWKTLKNILSYKKPSLQEQLNKLIPKYIKKDFDTQIVELYITGHSLGAALATLVTIDTILRYQNVPKNAPSISKIITYTLGTPRAGSRSLSALIKRLSEDCNYHFNLMRLVNTEDVVTTVPPPVFNHLIYSQLFISAPDACNSVSSINFSDNLGNVAYNHKTLLYFYANQQLMPDQKSAKSIEGIDQKPGDNKEGA